MPFPSLFSLRSAAVLSGVVLLLASCSGGEQRPIIAPTVQASLAQSAPPVSDGVVLFNNIITVGDTIKLDVVVQDSTGTLDVDDVDLVLRYDASFIQVVSLSGQNTLLGSCGTVNPVCGAPSPICIDNRSQANGGGDAFCRIDGSTPCSTGADCPSSGNACGSFGLLLASFAALTGPHLCSNNLSMSCFQDSDCLLCSGGNIITSSCTTDAECGGTCNLVIGKCASNFPLRSCTSDSDCADTCGGTCRPACPSVIVSGTKKIATVTLRVMREGTGDFRFVVSPSLGTPGVSALRKDLVDWPVLFFPNVDNNDPSIQNGAIAIVGKL
jgi:hypothetical protein